MVKEVCFTGSLERIADQPGHIFKSLKEIFISLSYRGNPSKSAIWKEATVGASHAITQKSLEKFLDLKKKSLIWWGKYTHIHRMNKNKFHTGELSAMLVSPTGSEATMVEGRWRFFQNRLPLATSVWLLLLSDQGYMGICHLEAVGLMQTRLC